MGGYSESSDEDRKRKKKKRKRSVSRSRETSVDSSISSRKSGKHKSKKKKRQRSRSRSRSMETKHRRRSRSRSQERGYRRSRSTSKSRNYKRSRSRSYERRRPRSRSRSLDRDRRTRRSPSFSSRQSYSRDRRSRSRSLDRRRRRSRSGSYDKAQKRDKDDPCSNVPGFTDMTPAEQARVRMQLALKAAAAADEKLKEQGVLLNPKSSMSTGEQKRFNKAIEKIERESFVPAAFTSTGDKPAFKEDDGFGRSNLERNHDSAIFGSGKLDMKLDPSERTHVVYTGATSLAHPNFLTMTRQPGKRRRRMELSLGDKVKLIKKFESSCPKISQSQLGKEFSIGRSTVSDILRQRQLYLDQFENNASPFKRRFNDCKYQEINELVWKWYDQARVIFGTVTGPHIQTKALGIARQLELSDFKASNGWLGNWRKRYSVPSMKTLEVESQSQVTSEGYSGRTIQTSVMRIDSMNHEEPDVKNELMENEADQYSSSTILAPAMRINNIDHEEPDVKNELMENEADQYSSSTILALEMKINNIDHEEPDVKKELMENEKQVYSNCAFHVAEVKDVNETEVAKVTDNNVASPLETMTYTDVLKSLETLKQFAIIKDPEFLVPVQTLISLTKDRLLEKTNNKQTNH